MKQSLNVLKGNSMMRYELVRILRGAAALAGLLCLATSAQACSVAPLNPRYDIVPSVLPTVATPADQPGGALPVGSLSGAWNGHFNNNAALGAPWGVFGLTGGCTGNVSTWAEPVLAPIAGLTVNISGTSYPVYPTGAPNIGYAVTVKDPNVAARPLSPNPTTPLWSGGAQNGTLGLDGAVVFVVTGPLTPGVYNIPSQDIGTMYYSTVSFSDNKSVQVPFGFVGTSLTVQALSCTVTSGASQTVALPTVSQGAFKGVGSTAGVQPFNIGVSCPAGIALYATMTDATTPTNTGNTLTLRAPSSAGGVGVQLFRSGSASPISFGPDSSVAGNTNQWFIGGSSGASATTYSLPFNAQYVQSAPTVTPGTVSALATITFSYQ